MSLQSYRQKRNFSRTPEPEKGGEKPGLFFVVQKHRARVLHYDLRLSAGGVLKSWAIPKEPGLAPGKNLAVMVEDHPLDYGDFEGVIPKGNYGAGPVMVWDRGEYFPINKLGKKMAESEAEAAILAGKLDFILNGDKLKGKYALVRIKNDKKNWLLIKKRDEYANKKIKDKEISVKTGRGLEEIEKAPFIEIDLSGARKSPFPDFKRPMLALAADKPISDPNMIFEIKLDGYRMIAAIKNKNVRLFSRNGILMNKRFKAIVEELEELKFEAVLDGEAVVLDAEGRPNFQLLQNYLKTGKGNLVLYAFDIIHYNIHDLSKLPLIRRKTILASVLPESKHVKKTEWIEEKGKEFFEQAAKLGLEGVIGKRIDSPYRFGKRSGEWIKIKKTKTQVAVVGGYTEPRGSRKGLGALVLGVYEKGDLKYIGHTGAGLSGRKLIEAEEKLKKLKRAQSPFKNSPKTNEEVRWVEPKVVCEVKFSEWTDSELLRHPVFEGWRDDKRPKDVRIEHVPELIEGNRPKEIKNFFSNLDKVFWPKEKYTKGDVVDYYERISEFILPYLKDRPENLNRHPNGIEQKGFYHKDLNKEAPEWAQTKKIYSESGNKEITYLLCQDKITLLYMANLGCVEINPWSSRINSLDKPDYAIMDLDPNDIGMKEAIRTALAANDILKKIGVLSLIKTSGGRGFHIFIPLGAKYTYEQSRNFIYLLGTAVHKRLPGITSLERSPAKRRKKVYLDYLQNRHGQTIAAVYSLRPKPGASVSTPLDWKEVKPGLEPASFNIKTIFPRLKKKGDLWKNSIGKGNRYGKSAFQVEKVFIAPPSFRVLPLSKGELEGVCRGEERTLPLEKPPTPSSINPAFP
jgi:bifunctional non-homologous end joining protein LigD